MTDTVDADLTIEQLAHESGMSVRNIRNHQTRGLLPPPVVRARTGYYGRQHVERLRLIQEMQSEGFNLGAIERLLGEDGGWADRLAGLRRAISAPTEVEAPEVVTVAELEERFGLDETDGKALAKAQRLGLLIKLGDGTFEVPSPELLRSAEEVVGRGIPLADALATIEKVRRNAETASRAFVRLFMEQVWKPFDEAGQPDDQWPAITGSIERLRPLSTQALTAVFRQAMADEVERAFGKALEHQAKKKL